MRSTIVVIDDDESVRHSLKWLVGSAGFHVVDFASAEAYLDAKTRPIDPVCFIVDINLPGVSGVELYALLKNQYPELPVIFITGYANQTLADKAQNLAAAGFFTKPLDTDKLLSCLNRLVAVAQRQ